MKRFFISLVVSCLAAIGAIAQTPYFSTSLTPNARYFLPPPPDTTDLRFMVDVNEYFAVKAIRPTERGTMAHDDHKYGIAKMAEIFSPIIGVNISDTETPAIYNFLNSAFSLIRVRIPASRTMAMV